MLISILFSVKSFVQKKLNPFDFLLYFIVSYFFFQQKMFMKLFEYINCENFIFDDSFREQYLKNYLGIKCYTIDHYFWLNLIIIPSFVFYGALLPISIVIFMNIKQKIFHERRKIIQYDFLMRQPFKSKCSNW